MIVHKTEVIVSQEADGAVLLLQIEVRSGHGNNHRRTPEADEKEEEVDNHFRCDVVCTKSWTALAVLQYFYGTLAIALAVQCLPLDAPREKSISDAKPVLPPSDRRLSVKGLRCYANLWPIPMQTLYLKASLYNT